MGRGGGGDFVANERAAAASFAQVARAEGIERVIYLGGLGDRPQSKHLRSRHETALALAEHGPPLTYFRAGMVVGAQSESYRTLRYLVQRLPAMIAPAWLKNATQPIAIDDTLRYLGAGTVDRGLDRQGIQIGGPDILSYGEMLDRMATVLDLRRRPRGKISDGYRDPDDGRSAARALARRHASPCRASTCRVSRVPSDTVGCRLRASAVA